MREGEIGMAKTNGKRYAEAPRGHSRLRKVRDGADTIRMSTSIPARNWPAVAPWEDAVVGMELTDRGILIPLPGFDLATARKRIGGRQLTEEE